jgi:hypothetical protein
MGEALLTILGFIGGWIAKSLIVPFKNTELYNKFFAKRFAELGKRLLGPRIQMQPIGLKEFGFEHLRYHVLQVGLHNRRQIPFRSRIDPQFRPWIEDALNLFVCQPIENMRVYTKFFDHRWESLPAPPSSLKRPFGLSPGVWKSLSCDGMFAVDVAGFSKWGDCYGALGSVHDRWNMQGKGDPEFDIPLGVGEFYLEVTAIDDKLDFIYCTSYFLLKNGGSIDSLELVPTKPPRMWRTWSISSV